MEPLAPLEDACTVVLLRDGDDGLETLMLERAHTSRVFAGAWVFPGGKVDPEDRADGIGGTVDDFTAAQRAGLREVAEETGQRLRIADLIWLSQWTPMQNIPRRFRTWFMLAPAASVTVELNPDEHANFAWLAPADALARHGSGEMLLVPPTWITLHHLTAMDTMSQALASAKAGQPFEYNTHILMPDGAVAVDAGPAGVMWAGDAAYPAPSPVSPGARHRLTITGLPWIFEQGPTD